MGIQTIVDFLASKGMEVDAKPNTKIDAEAYALIRSNFQDEKAAKEKAVSSANRAVVERESVTLASARKTAAPQEEAEVEIDLSIFQRASNNLRWNALSLKRPPNRLLLLKKRLLKRRPSRKPMRQARSRSSARLIWMQ